MFKRKHPKIISITAAVGGPSLFTLGLAKNGEVYSWNSVDLCWVPHQSKPVEQPTEGTDAET